jgi:molybdopterin molybdotransferase
MAICTVPEARAHVLSAVHRLSCHKKSLADALGCVLGADLIAPIPLPGWDNSAVDGFAVRAADVSSATENNPIHLRVVAEVPAGQAATGCVEPRTCVRIFTGAPIPDGADAVVMQELTRPHHQGFIAVLDPVEPGESIRRAGEDVKAGEIALPSGTLLGPAQIGLAAALGLPELTVHPRPRVGVLVTGAELMEPGQSLAPGQIYDSNSFAMAGYVREAGGEPVELGIADDTKEDLYEKLDYALSECDAVITVGGVSVGEYDLVKDVLADLGCEQRFWKVAMRPGRPFVFATRGQKLAFGLPGNPVSAAVTFLMLVRPALLKMRGLVELDLPVFEAEAAQDFVNPGDRTLFLRARRERVADKWLVHALPRQGSHMIASIAAADCLVEIPEVTTIPRGTIVKARLLHRTL